MDIPLAELQKLAAPAKLAYAEGYPSDASFQPALIAKAVKTARAAEVALVFIGLPAANDSEGGDRADIDLTRHQVALIQAVSAAQPWP